MVASAYNRASRTFWSVIGPASLLAVIGALIWFLVWFTEWNIRWHDGMWASMHENSALYHAEQAMIVNYGRQYASDLHFANPPAVKIHSVGLLNNGQAWRVQITGRSKRWCVIVWNPTDNWSKSHKVNIGSYYQIRRGCTFNATH